MTTVVLPQVVMEGTRHTASLPNPGTSSGGAVTAQVFGLSAADLADPKLEIVLTIQLQFHPGGDFQGQPGAEAVWRGGPTVASPPSVSWRDPYYRRARVQVEVSRFASLGVSLITP